MLELMAYRGLFVATVGIPLAKCNNGNNNNVTTTTAKTGGVNTQRFSMYGLVVNWHNGVPMTLVLGLPVDSKELPSGQWDLHWPT
jgi:hypothetical protein